MLCEFQLAEPGKAGKHRCRRCCRLVESDHPPERIFARCSGAPGESGKKSSVTPPGPVTRVGRYTRALVKWLAAGSPRRTEGEQAAALAICHSCEQYRPKMAGGGCALCGCSLAGIGGLTGKIEMATERCPADKWPSPDAHGMLTTAMPE